MSSAERIYRVVFHSQGKIYEIYARGVSDGGLLGFVEVEELTFGERTQVVVDPAEEKLKSEFAGVRRTYIPMHAIVRIDEVEKEGPARISDTDGNVTPFPMPVYSPGKGND
ncbi:DUF1820 family protein [Spiribacter sp. 2438]|uniref:DUF1820 family protein n=1 Tax=Spiribacter sp. 2438 TaxID=2666185 RepID=UPI0012B0A2A7|nr:DUF1820 family protein [Spiribacter sp. 2438]QGM21881.1 DUF1820 family protein [Spiribacter sp. 2438]